MVDAAARDNVEPSFIVPFAIIDCLGDAAGPLFGALRAAWARPDGQRRARTATTRDPHKAAPKSDTFRWK